MFNVYTPMAFPSILPAMKQQNSSTVCSPNTLAGKCTDHSHKLQRSCLRQVQRFTVRWLGVDIIQTSRIRSDLCHEPNTCHGSESAVNVVSLQFSSLQSCSSTGRYHLDQSVCESSLSSPSAMVTRTLLESCRDLGTDSGSISIRYDGH